MAAARRALACACAAMACVAVEGAKGASSGRQLKSVYTTIVNRHISEIMTLFLSDTLNFEWSSRLVSQRPVPTSDLGELTHQQYALPWPLAPREMLMQCERHRYRREDKFTSTCRSVDHPAFPRHSGAVRVHITISHWEITALPDERTQLRREIAQI